MAKQSLIETQSGSYTGNGASNNEKANDNFSELFTETVVVPLVANGSSKGYYALPADRTLSAIYAHRMSAISSALGSVTAAIARMSDSARLILTPTIDAEAFTASPVSKSLTGTTENLTMVAGEVIEITLTSNNADATGGPAVFTFVF